MCVLQWRRVLCSDTGEVDEVRRAKVRQSSGCESRASGLRGTPVAPQVKRSPVEFGTDSSFSPGTSCRRCRRVRGQTPVRAEGDTPLPSRSIWMRRVAAQSQQRRSTSTTPPHQAPTLASPFGRAGHPSHERPRIACRLHGRAYFASSVWFATCQSRSLFQHISESFLATATRALAKPARLFTRR